MPLATVGNAVAQGAGVNIAAGSGSPEGVVTAPPGALWMQTDSPALWQKMTGVDATGWAQVGGASGLFPFVVSTTQAGFNEDAFGAHVDGRGQAVPRYTSLSVFAEAEYAAFEAQVWRSGAAFGPEAALWLGSARGTDASPSQPLSGDVLGTIWYGGYRGAGNYREAIILQGVAASTWTETNTESKLYVYTTAANQITGTLRWVVQSDGGFTTPTDPGWPAEFGAGGANLLTAAPLRIANVTGAGAGGWYTTNTYNIMVGTTQYIGLSMEGRNQTGLEIDMFQWESAGNNYSPGIYAGKLRGTPLAPSLILNGDLMFWMEFASYKGSGTYPNDRGSGANWFVVADGDWSTTSFPTRFEWYTAPVGGTSGLLRLTLGANGFLTHTATDLVTLGTITATQFVRDDSVTWNNAGLTFVGWRLSVTNTASVLGSKLVDVRLGTTTRFAIQATGNGSTPWLQLTPPDNSPGLGITASRVTAAGSSESVLTVTSNLNTTGNPSLVYFNAVNAGGAGTSTQLFRVARDGGTLFNVMWEGQVGLAGGSTSDVQVRIGQGSNVSTIEEGLQVNTLHSNTSFLSHWVVNVLGGGASGSAYTTPEVYSIQVGTYVKALNQTITTWYGLDILAGPAAGTKWSIRTAESVWIKGSLTVDGTITGTLGSGFAALDALTDVIISSPSTGQVLRYNGTNWVNAAVAEGDITDGSILARVAANETISGTWTFDSPVAVGLGGSTSSVSASGMSSFQYDQVGNVTTGEDDLMTYTLPANAFDTGTRAVHVKAWGAMAPNTNAKTIKFYFGSTSITLVNATVNAAHTNWTADLFIVRKGTDSQEIAGESYVVTDTGAHALIALWIGTGSAQDDAAAITIKFTGDATATDDVVQHGMFVEFFN